MAINRNELAKWIRRQLADITELGQVSRFDLVHSQSGAGPENLDSWAANAHEPEDLAEIIATTSRQDADTRLNGMPERYAVIAFRSDDTTQSQFPFLQEAAPRAMGAGESSDPPTAVGLVGQSMRHSEAAVKLAVGQSALTIANLREELQRERTLRLEAETSLDEFVQRERASREPINALTGIITSVLPVLLAQYLGGSSGGNNPAVAAISQAVIPKSQKQVQNVKAPELPALSVEFQALQKIMTGLSQQEFMKLAQAVSEVHQIGFFEVYTEMQKPNPNLPIVEIAATKLILDLSETEVENVMSALRAEYSQVFLEILQRLNAKENAKGNVKKVVETPA